MGCQITAHVTQKRRKHTVLQGDVWLPDAHPAAHSFPLLKRTGGEDKTIKTGRCLSVTLMAKTDLTWGKLIYCQLKIDSDGKKCRWKLEQLLPRLDFAAPSPPERRRWWVLRSLCHGSSGCLVLLTRSPAPAWALHGCSSPQGNQLPKCAFPRCCQPGWGAQPCLRWGGQNQLEPARTSHVWAGQPLSSLSATCCPCQRWGIRYVGRYTLVYFNNQVQCLHKLSVMYPDGTSQALPRTFRSQAPSRVTAVGLVRACIYLLCVFASTDTQVCTRYPLNSVCISSLEKRGKKMRSMVVVGFILPTFTCWVPLSLFRIPWRGQPLWVQSDRQCPDKG